MIEVYSNLYVGNEADASTVLHTPGWYIVHACKEPFHRQALGYTGRGAPKNHPEFLIAERDGRLILNLVDAPNPAYIPKDVIDAALAAIHQNISKSKVLVHCNLGMSRSPTIALLYLLKHTEKLNFESLSGVLEKFKALYPAYSSAGRMAGFVEKNWLEYAGRSI